MDVILQNSNTALYLKRDLSWTARREEAFVFLSSGEAIDFAYEHQLHEVHIVLFFNNLSHSLVVPFQADTAYRLQSGPRAIGKMDRPEPL